MSYFIDSNGNYFEVIGGDGSAPPNSLAVPQRPAANYRWENESWVKFEEQIPNEVMGQPILYAAAQLRVQDFDVTGIGINSRFGGAFWGDTGKYYVFFSETQPDLEYIAMASAPAFNAYVLNEEKTEDMFVITVTDSAGQPADAETVNIQILRAS